MKHEIPSRLRLPHLAILLAAIGLPIVAAGESAYTLFMGADIAIEQGDKFYRVENVTGSAFKITVDGKTTLVPTRRNSARLRIDLGLKLAGTPANIESVVAERTYTPANDPQRKFEAMAGAAAGASAAADLANYNVSVAQAALNQPLSPYAPPDARAQLEGMLESATRSQMNAQQQMSSDLTSPGTLAGRRAHELAEGNYDALSVTVKLSSPVPLDDPYLLIIANIRERDAKPGLTRNWIYAERLDSIGEKPRTIWITQGGFPEGYELEDCEVRVYNHGREVPTNHSPKRVALTREEAHEYIMIGHLSAHKDDSVEAAAVLGEAPEGLKDRIRAGTVQDAFFVKVGSDGRPTAMYADAACSQAVGDPLVESTLDGLLYVPALKDGKPVPGIARVRIAQLLN